MAPRYWLRPVLLGLLLTGCSSWFAAEKPAARNKKKRRKGRKAQVEAKRERQASPDANAHVASSGPEKVLGTAPADAPNILLISLDTLRADALPPYGGLADNAPALTALANEGIHFQNAYAQAPSTSPTHASMFTSLLPSEHGVMGTQNRLPLQHWTLAEHLQAYGYRTWASTSSVRFALGVQLNQGFDEYAVYSQGTQYEKSTNAMEVALATIPVQPDTPWFGFVHLMDVHAPYLVPEPHQSKYLKGPPSVPPEKTVRFLHRHRVQKQAVSAQQLADLKAMYLGGVSHVDTRIAQIVDAVKQLERPTLVVVTADHGEAFFEKNYLGHGSFVHEAIMRVPLIFWGPGLVEPGAPRTALAQSIDLFPTLTAYAKVPAPDDLRGENLRPVIEGSDGPTGRTVIGQSRQRAMLVRELDGGIYKLVLNGKNRKPRLYALHDDPLEQNNLAQTNREIVSQLKPDLKAVSFRALTSHRDHREEQWEMSDAEREALEAIGYMDADE